jgi:hypothetical protein
MKTTTTLLAAAAVALSFAGPRALAAPTGTYQETAVASACKINSNHVCALYLPALPSTNALQVQAASCQINLYFGNWFTPPPDFIYISLSDGTGANPIFMEYFNNTSWPDGGNSSGQETGNWYYTAHIPAGSISYIAAGQKPLVRFQLGTSYYGFTSANIQCTLAGSLISP